MGPRKMLVIFWERHAFSLDGNSRVARIEIGRKQSDAVAGPSPAISSKRPNKVLFLFYFNNKLATCW